MAVTTTQAAVTVAIRAAASASAIPAEVTAAMDLIFPAAVAIVTEYAPAAPDAVQNAAVVRLAGWLYDADPTDSRSMDAIRVSGAAPLLMPWRVHRAGAIAGAGAAPGPSPSPTPSGLPTPPASGHFILTVTNGVLSWVEFPQPPS